MTLETLFIGAVLGIGGGILLLALFALLARLTAASEDLPNLDMTKLDIYEPDQVDIRALLRKYSED
jgi:hypothetical protein